MNVAGLSGHSNGVANLMLDKQSSAAKEFYRLNDADNIQMHPWVPDLATVPVAIADSFLSAKKNLIADNRRLTLDSRQMVDEILRSVVVTSPSDRQMARGKLRQTIDDDRDMQAWFDTLPDPPLPSVGRCNRCLRKRRVFSQCPGRSMGNREHCRCGGIHGQGTLPG